MLNLNSINRTLTPLTCTTPHGLFIAEGGIRFWIFNNPAGTFAVQLDPSADRPAFSFYHLDGGVVCMGIWLSPAQLKVTTAAESSFMRKCGLIILSGIRAYLKVSDPRGYQQRLMIYPYDNGKPRRYSEYYPGWALYALTDSGRVCFFQSAAEPPYLPGHRRGDLRVSPTPPQLTLVQTP